MVGETHPAPSLVSFQCENCGSAVPVRAMGQSQTFACPACGAVMQEGNQGLKILIHASQKMIYKSLLELGSKAEFRGEKWQVIGFMVRCDGPGEYFWNEYLLYNPFQGFRFLMEADGHWNFLNVTKRVPKPVVWSHKSGMSWSGARYARFHAGTARVVFVLGEFYWRAKVGDVATVVDYIAPPDLLSSEETEGEVIWSSGTYIAPDAIQKSFQLTAPMPPPLGIAPNQPSIYYKQRRELLTIWGTYLIALLFIQYCLVTRSKNETVLRMRQDLSVAKTTFRSEPFEVPEANVSVGVNLRADLQNSWIDVVGTMVPESGQAEAFSFQRELSSYYDDEGDTEGDNEYSLFFPRLAKGLYHLEFEVAREIKTPLNALALNVETTLDPSFQMPFWISVGLLSLAPLIFFQFDYAFEQGRWKHSNQREPGT